MRWTYFLVGLSLLAPTGCGGSGGGGSTEIRFLIMANGIIDQALLDGRLSAVVFPEQTAAELKVSRLESSDAMNPGLNPFGFKPGTYHGYAFPVSIGDLRFADARIHVENPLPTKGPFKLSNIKALGALQLTGSERNTVLTGAPFRAFSATLDPTWKGAVENKAASAR
jgi:hypothetical protein